MAGLGGVELTGVSAVLSPAALAALGAVVALPAPVVVLVVARRRPATTDVLGWGCGGVRTSPRMQYNATSYAEPVMRIFDDALQPRRDVVVTHVGESAYLAERVRFAQQVDDVVEVRLYRPLVAAADALADRARREGWSRLGVLGTRWVMEEDFYVGRLARAGLTVDVPDAAARGEVDRIIFDELTQGIITDESRAVFVAAIDDLAARGAEAVVLACTEIELLIGQDDSRLPVLDSMALHAQAAAEACLADA